MRDVFLLGHLGGMKQIKRVKDLDCFLVVCTVSPEEGARAPLHLATRTVFDSLGAATRYAVNIPRAPQVVEAFPMAITKL